MRTPILSVGARNACVRAHMLIHTYACRLAHTNGMFALSLSPPLQLPHARLPASPALTDVLFHLAPLKLRRHGYSCRDVLSPGDGQY